jgi:hypothetical protein
MLTKDAKTVARASYGRYYMPITLENLRRYGPDMDPFRIEQYNYKIPWDQFDMNHNNWVDPDEVAYWTPRLRDLTPYTHTTRTIDRSWQLFTSPDLKDQFTDQITFNIEREIVPEPRPLIDQTNDRHESWEFYLIRHFKPGHSPNRVIGTYNAGSAILAQPAGFPRVCDTRIGCSAFALGYQADAGDAARTKGAK